MKKVEMKEMRSLEAGTYGYNPYAYFNAVKGQLFAAHKIADAAEFAIDAAQKIGFGLFTVNQFAKGALFVQKTIANFAFFQKAQCIEWAKYWGK